MRLSVVLLTPNKLCLYPLLSIGHTFKSLGHIVTIDDKKFKFTPIKHKENHGRHRSKSNAAANAAKEAKARKARLQQEAREHEIKAQAHEDHLLKEACVDRNRLQKEAREAKAEERYAALLTSISGTAIPVQNAEQLLISTLPNRIDMFNYVLDEDLHFQLWYKRNGDIFKDDGKEVTDAAKARMLVHKLGTQEYNKLEATHVSIRSNCQQWRSHTILVSELLTNSCFCCSDHIVQEMACPRNGMLYRVLKFDSDTTNELHFSFAISKFEFFAF